jgi:K(+)-stimulated pyrophosphate-energized sodium pump
MQQWRYIGLVTVALWVLAVPGTVPAQEPAKKTSVPADTTVKGAAPAAETTQGAAPAAEALKGETLRPNQPRPGAAASARAASPGTAQDKKPFAWFAFMTDPAYDIYEQIALYMVLLVAIAGLLYAMGLVNQVLGADEGTQRMRDIGLAIRQGANAYLWRQAKAILLLVFLLAALVYFSAKESGQEVASGRAAAVAWGRAAAFVMGAIFSWMVGFVGMRLAVRGNLRVAAAARTSYGTALQLGYRTGTITGMLTDGLGLLGGTVIFMAYGEHAYAVLLGFGFGGTLLALFMRVGGGIYTKAADVGADLVGKVEAGIPEDDPRNAATIADNVGDNVGDCAGMAADIFESYEVTIVAAMILGYASFGHKGVIFPLLVRAIGVLGSIWSTYTVKAGPNSTSDEALHSVHRGFVLGSIFSVVGFVLLGFAYLHFDTKYYADYPQALGSAMLEPGFKADKEKFERDHISDRNQDPIAYKQLVSDFIKNREGDLFDSRLPFWASFGFKGLDMRPAWTCLIGIILAITLNKTTSYYTHTQYSPVKTLAKSCQTGHATNIIQGFAVGYESAVVATLVIAVAILLSVLIYSGATSPIFVAYGVAMCGIGMLTLTGNTISMDVFGPWPITPMVSARWDTTARRWARRTISARGKFWPISTQWATRPRPRPRELLSEAL